MTKKTKFWLPLLVAMLMVATVVVAACAETATVSYAKGADGATGTVPEAQVVTVGEEIELIANPFTYEGHTFAGWSDGSKTYKAGDKYKVSGNVTFTATWTKVSGGEEHKCDHVCDQCGKCTDQNCKDPACADKCQGHQSAPVLDARSYFLRGSINGWTTEGYVFTRTEGTNTYTLEGVELKAGDAIKLCYNSEWTVGGKQMSYGAYFFPENVFGTSDQWDGNAVVKSGADGIYDITLKTSNNLTATTERGEGQITEFTFTKVGDIQKPVEPFAKAHFNGALGSMTSMEILSVLSFSDDGYVFAMVVEATNSYGCDARYTVAEDGTITITDGGDTIGTGTIVGNVITVTITLDSDEDSTSKQFTFTGEMYEATLIQDGESAEMYIAEGTPLYLLVMWGDEDVVVKVNGNVVPRDQLATTKMPKEKVTIEIISPEKPIESDITGPINAVILHSSKTQSGAQIEGTLWLNEMGYGSLMLVNKNSGLTILECYFDYELADGIITFTSVYDEDDNPVKATISGKVVGRTITITVTNTINGTPTEYVFESTLHKLTISKVMNMDYNYVWYLPAGYAYTDFVLRVPEGYVLSKVLVNGDEREASYIESISISEDTVVELVWEEEKVDDKPTIPTLSGKIIEYAGATESTPVNYGYESAEAADGNVLTWTSSLGSNPVITIYSISIFWRAGIYTPQFAVTIGATGITSTAATNMQLKLGGQVIKDKETANAVLTIKVSDLEISIYLYKAEDGTRQILLVSDKGFVTWACTTSEDVEPDHTCEHKCPICQGCLTSSCQESACSTKCQGHEDHTYDGEYFNSTGTTDLEYVLGIATKIVLNGNTLTLYDSQNEEIDTIKLTWSENVGTGTCGRYDVTVTVGDNMLTIEFDGGRYSNFKYSFYTEGHEPEEPDYAEILSEYEGTWKGSLQISSTTFDSIIIKDGKIQLHDADYQDKWFEDGLYDFVIDSVTKSMTGKLVVNISYSTTYTGKITFSSVTTLTLDLTKGSASRSEEFTLDAGTESDSDITGPVNATILLKSSDGKIGSVNLYEYDPEYGATGDFSIYASNSSYALLEYAFKYTLSDGVITVTAVYDIEDWEYSRPLSKNISISGVVVGRTITVTVVDNSKGDATEYVFESTLFKLTLKNMWDYYEEEFCDKVQYLPAGNGYYFYLDEPDDTSLQKLIVNGEDKDASYLDSVSISEDTVIEFIWKTSGGEEGGGDVYTGEVTGSPAGSAGAITVVKVVIDTTAGTVHIEYKVDGGEIKTADVSLTEGDKGWYEGSKTDLVEYWETTACVSDISSFKKIEFAIYSDGTMIVCVDDTPLTGYLSK